LRSKDSPRRGKRGAEDKREVEGGYRSDEGRGKNGLYKMYLLGSSRRRMQSLGNVGI